MKWSLRQLCVEGYFYWMRNGVDHSKYVVLMGWEDQRYSTRSGASCLPTAVAIRPFPISDTMHNNDNQDNCRRNRWRKAGNANNVEGSGSSAIPSSPSTACRTRTAPTAVQIWYQQELHRLQSNSQPLSTKTINDELFCRFVLAASP